jgi:hypothetical protein
MAYKCLLDSATKVVVNTIELEDGAVWTLPAGTELAPQHDGGIGDTWDGAQFVKPPEPVDETAPPSPTKEQLMAELAALTAKIQALE